MRWTSRALLVLVVAASAVPLAQVRTPQADPLIASSKVAVVDTASGKIQGFIHHGIYTSICSPGSRR
jgi:hypothetical protein